jgi:hypothetical protein
VNDEHRAGDLVDPAADVVAAEQTIARVFHRRAIPGFPDPDASGHSSFLSVLRFLDAVVDGS